MAGRNAQADSSGCGWALAIGILVIAVSKCGSDNSNSDASYLAPTSSVRYVTASALNCRAEPDTSSISVEKFAHGDTLSVSDNQHGWSQINGSHGHCWVSNDYLSSYREAPLPTPTRQPLLVSSQPLAGPGRSCGAAPYCTGMSSCEEAQFYFRHCGVSRLDGDNDGIPCENLC